MGVCGIILLLGVVCVLLEKPWVHDFKVKKCIFGLFVIAFAVCFALFYTYVYFFPDVLSYTGELIEIKRNSKVAPPLPLTYEYVFLDGEGEKRVFYLDVFSKDIIFPDDFEYGQLYTVHFDDYTNIIVAIEFGV